MGNSRGHEGAVSSESKCVRMTVLYESVEDSEASEDTQGDVWLLTGDLRP